jgi:hypothetical protein
MSGGQTPNIFIHSAMLTLLLWLSLRPISLNGIQHRWCFATSAIIYGTNKALERPSTQLPAMSSALQQLG